MLDALQAWVPRSLRARTVAAARDARMLAGRLRGQRPPPFLARAAGRTVAAVATRGARIVEVVRETADAVSLVLEDEAGRPFDHVPGQFLTLVVTLPGGATARRAYSIAWSTDDARRVAVGVKRVPGGLVSTHLVERCRPGDRLEVLGPSGSFVPAASDGPRVVLVGGGSGVTPLLRLARHLLAAREDAQVALVLANRTAGDVIFRRQLDGLVEEHRARFALVHVLDDGGQGAVRGPLTRDVAILALGALPFPIDDRTTFFVCGPAGMMDEARAALRDLGVAPSRVREERFATAERAAASAPTAQRVTFRLPGGASRDVVARPGATLLEAGLEAGLALPYSCTLGGCGACKVRAAGPVLSAEPSCLDDAERAAGHVLACVSTPCGHVTVEVP